MVKENIARKPSEQMYNAIFLTSLLTATVARIGRAATVYRGQSRGARELGLEAGQGGSLALGKRGGQSRHPNGC